MKSVLVIFIISAISALAHGSRDIYDFEELNDEYQSGSNEEFGGPRIPWDLPKSSAVRLPNSPIYPRYMRENSWSSDNEDQSESLEKVGGPRIPWDLPKNNAPELVDFQYFLASLRQPRMNWPGYSVPSFEKFGKRSNLDQERMKKIMTELEVVAKNVYDTFEIFKKATEENSQEEIDNIVSDALEDTLGSMNDAKDYAVETGGEKYKKCIAGLEDDLQRVMEETKEIPVPDCSSNDYNEIMYSFEEKIQKFNDTMDEITEINEKIYNKIKNCPFRNPRPCHKGILSLENKARHAIREGNHQIQMMEKAMDSQAVEMDECRDSYLESLIAQENEYNELLEQCTSENSYENDEYNEIMYDEEEYILGNQGDEEEKEIIENTNELVDENDDDEDNETKKEEINEDQEDVNEDVADNEENKDEENNEENKDEENNEENIEEETEYTTPQTLF